MNRFRPVLLFVFLALLAVPLHAQRACPAPTPAPPPQSQTIVQGQSATLSTQVNTLTRFPVTYRWYQGVSGDTSLLISETRGHHLDDRHNYCQSNHHHKLLGPGYGQLQPS